MKEMTRKEFLKLTGASTALLAMSHIIPTSAYADTSKIDAPSAGMYISEVVDLSGLSPVEQEKILTERNIPYDSTITYEKIVVERPAARDSYKGVPYRFQITYGNKPVKNERRSVVSPAAAAVLDRGVNILIGLTKPYIWIPFTASGLTPSQIFIYSDPSQYASTNIYEEQEEGVSGHKVRAEARDKLQIIKEYARKGKFDILLVFMFDRIGRIADETPFVVEWFVRNGIRVWSTQEGEQRFDNHTDKLLNYIRFWQADGESEKTSVRTRTSLRQLVEEGHFKGGSAPYGYDLVKSGRINKRKHELYELHINEQEAEIVRLIFDKYVYEGYGAQRIATYLNNAGYRARSGKCWHPGSLRGMVGNLTYMGVLRCGDARSELMPELQIIPQEEFEAAQRIREDRSAHAAEEAEHHVPLRTRGQALLSNNVYCGHCGARLALTTSRKWRKLSDGTLDDTLRIRYTCYGKLRKQTDCTGQTGYTMHILDEIIDKMVRQIFSRLRGIPKEQLITSRYAKETAERKNHLQALQAERDKAEKDLLALKTEILAVIKGESAFPKDTLAEMIAAQEKKHTELDTLCEEASAELERNAELMANVSQLYEELISYADLYDSASFEAKKMIVSQLIRRVEVYRGYQIHVDFNFDLAQYLENSDELAC